MEKRIHLIGVFIIMIMIVFSGCSEKAEKKGTGVPAGETASAPVIATIGDDHITVEDFKSYVGTHPMPRQAMQDKEVVKRTLDGLVDEEILYQAAVKSGINKKPEVRTIIRRIVSQAFLDEKIKKDVAQKQIDQTELRNYYDAHQDEFNRPEMVRVADIFIAVPPDAPNGQRLKLKKKADDVLAEALKMPNQRTGFPQLINRYSDTPQNYAKGDTGFFDKEGGPIGIDPKLAEAAFQLKKHGDICERVVDGNDGYHIIMQLSRRKAFNRPFEKISRYLEQRIRNEEMRKERDALIVSLKEKETVSINKDALAEFQKDWIESMKNRSPAPGGRRAKAFPRRGPLPPPMMNH